MDIFNIEPPSTYLDLHIMPIAHVKSADRCTIRGTITYVYTTPRCMIVTVHDATDSIRAIFFSYNHYHLALCKTGKVVTLAGRIRNGEMIQPKIIPALDVNTIKPIYKRKSYVRTVRKALESITDEHDIVPKRIQKERGLPGLRETLRMLHFPVNYDEVELARWRLAYTELYTETLNAKKRHKGIMINVNNKAIENFINTVFPFELTTDQKRAVFEIINDLRSDFAMRRLLVGDVGSGKTEVAICSAYAAIQGGYNVLYLCPTEVLAVQTHRRIFRYFRCLQDYVHVALCTANTYIGEVSPDVVVGTHALIYNIKKYRNVGLVIIDEQHKFGVKQREMLVDSGCNLLEITATPIPRSYAMYMQNIMNISMLRELPYKRNVETSIITDKKYDGILKLIADEVNQGNQALIIYPSVESSERNLKPAREAYKYWKKRYNKGAALLHGKMINKHIILERFSKGEISVLVSTTASEVGIDIARLTVCVVANAERFGLSQLHQIRGRIGRRGTKGHYILICKNSNSIERLKPLITMDDGFDIAEIDTTSRGWGMLNGSTQSGHFFRYFIPNYDVEISEAVKNDQ